MDNKKKYLLLIVPVVGLIIFLLYKNMFVEFEPIIFEDSSYKKVEVNNKFYRNLEIVLDYNKVDYKTNKQGRVLIKRSLTFDKELIFNYTKKSFDTAWINSNSIFK
jgi:hypothetical protein